MARLPSRRDISQPIAGRSGRAIASIDTSGLGRGIESLGNSLSDIGAQFEQQQGTAQLANADADYTNNILTAEREIENGGDYSNFQSTFDQRARTSIDEAAKTIGNSRFRERWVASKQEDLARRRQNIADKANTGIRAGNRVNLSNAIEKDQNLFTDPLTSEDEKQAALGRINDSIASAEHTGLLDPVTAETWRETYRNGSVLKEAELRVLNDPAFRNQVLRGDAPPADEVINAVIGVESEGDATQLSPKGAAGVMQVMPGTAGEIAREIDDANFPARGTDAEKQAYLQDPKIGKEYGTYYLNKMLTKYGGDLDAALVAYNGGPARADAWLSAGKDDSVLPKETADYYKKVNARLSGQPTTFQAGEISGAKDYLKSHTDKDASHIDGMNDTFAVKVSRLLQAAPPEIRGKLGIYSGARSTERQAELWASALKKYGSEAEARKWVAPPGKSQHNHGNAADLAFDGKSLKNAPAEVVNWLHDNAGAYGLKFPLGNENWHIEDSSTRGGKGVLRDGRYADLSPEQRNNLFAVARKSEAEQNAAAAGRLKVEASAVNDDYRLRISTFDPTLKSQDILSDPRIDAGQKATLINSFNQERDANAGAEALISAISAGQSVQINAFDAEQAKAAEKAYNRMVGPLGDDQRQAGTESFIKSTGYIPKTIEAEVRAGASSTDPQVVAGAMQQASALSRLTPSNFSSMPGSDVVGKKLDLYKTYTDTMGLTPAEAGAKIVAADDPEQIRKRDAILKSEPVKKLLKDINADDVAAMFDKGTFSAAPGVEGLATPDGIRIGVNPQSEAAIVADYRRTMEEALIDANGDQSAAEDIAKRRFSKVYGTTDLSPLSNNIVVRYPPEKAYPALPDGSHDYIRNQLVESLKNEGVEADQFYLQGDMQTEQDIKAGRPARYQVFYEKDGKLERYNLPFYADPDIANAEYRAKDDLRVKDAEQRMLEGRVEENRVYPEGRGVGRLERFGNDQLYRGIARENSPMGRALERARQQQERVDAWRKQEDERRRTLEALSPEEQRQQSLDDYLNGVVR